MLYFLISSSIHTMKSYAYKVFFFFGGGGGGGGGEREREMAKIYYGISKHKVSLVVLQIYNEII
jgi:hypothetical protein